MTTKTKSVFKYIICKHIEFLGDPMIITEYIGFLCAFCCGFHHWNCAFNLVLSLLYWVSRWSNDNYNMPHPLCAILLPTQRRAPLLVFGTACFFRLFILLAQGAPATSPNGRYMACSMFYVKPKAFFIMSFWGWNTNPGREYWVVCKRNILIESLLFNNHSFETTCYSHFH
jgi:hypothetical protein